MWTYEKKARYASCTYKKPPKACALHTNSLIFCLLFNLHKFYMLDLCKYTNVL